MEEVKKPDKKIRLVNVFESRESWQRLALLKMPPHTAYKLLKYFKTLNEEFEIIEQQRVNLVREIANAGENESASINPGTPEYAQLVERFNKILETETDRTPFPMKMASLLDIIGKEQGNLLSVQDLGFLEAFFEGDPEQAAPSKDR